MIALFALVVAVAAQQPRVAGLRVEYLPNPLGIDVAKPRLSWRITSSERNTVQVAYQIQVTRDAKVIWDSGRTTSDASVFVPYDGPALESRARYTWRVRVWDAKGRASPWAEGWWETGLLAPSDWSAAWIGTPPTPSDSLPSPAPMLRRSFRVGGAIQQARVYATSLGIYELHLNGQRVGDQLFTPGWTS